jgi:GNAT superfamily N-acetyltransferase
MEIRYAAAGDRSGWFRLDRHLPESGFEEKVRNRQGYVLTEDGRVIGVLRFNLFWDSVPFCTLLFIDAAYRKQGYGRRLMEHWERDMQSQGHGLLMTSTQVDEEAQHFYRRLGYKDSGGFVIDVPGYAQPMELIMVKAV